MPPLLPTPRLEPTPRPHLELNLGEVGEGETLRTDVNEDTDSYCLLDSSTKTSGTSTPSSGSNSGSSGGAIGLALSSFGVAGVVGAFAVLL